MRKNKFKTLSKALVRGVNTKNIFFTKKMDFMTINMA